MDEGEEYGMAIFPSIHPSSKANTSICSALGGGVGGGGGGMRKSLCKIF